MKHSVSRNRQMWWWGVGLILLGLIGFGAGYEYWAVLDHRFLAITPGRVYSSGAMPSEALAQKVKKYGIKTIIDLRKSEEQQAIDAEHIAMERIGVTHINLPTKQIPEVETVMAFLEIMKKPAAYPVLIHCHHGEGRAVLFSAMYRIEFEGWSNERALNATRLILWRSSFSTERTKGAFLKNYIPRLKDLADDREK